MRVRIKRRANGAYIRIPAPLMVAAALRFDQTVEMTEKEGRIIIQPIVSVAYELDRMIDAMDPATFPEDADFGPPRGKEVW